MENLKNNIETLTNSCLNIFNKMNDDNNKNKNRYKSVYSEIYLSTESEDDQVKLTNVYEQLDEIIKENTEIDFKLTKEQVDDLTKVKESLKIVYDKIKKEEINIIKETQKNQKEINNLLEKLKNEISNYSNIENMAVFRIVLDSFNENQKVKIRNTLNDLGFYFSRKSFNFDIFIGEIISVKKTQSVKNHINKNLEEVVPEINKVKGNTSATYVRNLENLIMWLR